jgi:hypothetical protein
MNESEESIFIAHFDCNANRGVEARELLTKLLGTSKRVLGPHHNMTKEVESDLEKVIEVANED